MHDGLEGPGSGHRESRLRWTGDEPPAAGGQHPTVVDKKSIDVDGGPIAQDVPGLNGATLAASNYLDRAPKGAIILRIDQVLQLNGVKLGVWDLDQTILRTAEYHDGAHGRFAFALRTGLQELDKNVSNERWELLWEGDRDKGVGGFRDATGQSEDDVFESLRRKAEDAFGVAPSTDRLKELNRIFINDHFEAHHELIEEIQAAIGLIKATKGSGGRLGLCTSSGEAFVQKLFAIAEDANIDKFNFLKEFDLVHTNAKKVDGDGFNGDPVRKICVSAGEHRDSTVMFGDSIADIGTAGHAGVSLAVIATNAEGQAHVDRTRAIVEQIEQATRLHPDLVSVTQVVIVNSFDQVRLGRTNAKGVSFNIGTAEDLGLVGPQ